MPFTAPAVNPYCLLPEMILLVAALIVLFLRGEDGRTNAELTASVAVVFGMAAVPHLWGESLAGFGGAIVKDNGTLVFQFLIALAAFFTILLSHEYLGREKNAAEYYALMLLSLFGMQVMAAARDLLVVFLALEIVSLPLYILAGFFKDAAEGKEAAVKYFLLGSFSSALFLLGLAFCYGALGTVALKDLSVVSPSPMLLAGICLVISGLAFKTAAVPFHMWAPDTYEGAPVSVAAFISVVPKIAAFAVLYRIGFAAAGAGEVTAVAIVLAMAVASMIVGNLAALRQTGLVRMLAYSGIAQSGYMLIGFAAPGSDGSASLAFYLAVYVFMNLGAFMTAVHLSAHRGKTIAIDDLAGLASRRPLLAFAMAVFMVSLAGIPPTGGFFAKFYIFKTGIEADWLPVVIVAVVMTVVSLFYYLRVVMVMYMRENAGAVGYRPGVSLVAGLMVLAAAALLFTGILPQPVLDVVQAAFAG